MKVEGRVVILFPMPLDFHVGQYVRVCDDEHHRRGCIVAIQRYEFIPAAFDPAVASDASPTLVMHLSVSIEGQIYQFSPEQVEPESWRDTIAALDLDKDFVPSYPGSTVRPLWEYLHMRHESGQIYQGFLIFGDMDRKIVAFVPYEPELSNQEKFLVPLSLRDLKCFPGSQMPEPVLV